MNEQDELLPTEEEIIARCKLSPKTVKLLRDMSEETYKEIAREIIFLAKPIILAKVKQHYEQKLQRMALNYNTIIIEGARKQERERSEPRR